MKFSLSNVIRDILWSVSTILKKTCAQLEHRHPVDKLRAGYIRDFGDFFLVRVIFETQSHMIFIG